MKDLQEQIEKILKETENDLKRIYRLQKNDDKSAEPDSKLRFSKKRNEQLRISEQELRFLFVEKMARSTNLKYSIEAPTLDIYNFSGSGNKRSGNIDLVIYNEEGQRAAIIEFKALNPSKTCFSKDFAKLGNPNEGEDALRYFIHVVEACNQDTIDAIESKSHNKNDNVEYRRICLTEQ